MILWRSWWARFAILAILFGAALVPLTARGRALGWSLALAATAATGIGLLRMSSREREDMKRVAKADRFAAPKDGERFAVCGVIEAEGEPLVTPVQRTPSVLYHYSVFHRESAGGNRGMKDVLDFTGYGATPARIGGLRLGAFPKLHGFEATSIGSERARNHMEEHLRFARFKEKKKGEIEWVSIEDDLWDGDAPVALNFRRGEGRPMEQCFFHEASVEPGGKSLCDRGLVGEAQCPDRRAVAVPRHQGIGPGDARRRRRLRPIPRRRADPRQHRSGGVRGGSALILRMLKRNPGAVLGLWTALHVGAYALVVRSGWPGRGEAPLLPPGAAMFAGALLPAIAFRLSLGRSLWLAQPRSRES